MINIIDKGGKVSFKVKVQPRASKNGLAGIMEDAVKLRITAPPVDGEANKGVIQFFARLFGISQKEVAIISGISSRTKIVEISGVAVSEVAEILNDLSS